MLNIKCIVVDDEELARALIISYIEKVPFLEVVADFDNPIDAMVLLKESKIDVVFLDIQMPELKGTDLARLVPINTKIIFTTAYSEYAFEGFELDAVDYLLKPITFERFLKAVNKVKESKLRFLSEDAITIKSGYDFYKVYYKDINHIESDSEYVVFHTKEKRIMSYQSLKSLEKSLPKGIFKRVHRSYIINKTKVTGLKGKELILNNYSIPVSSSYIESVKKELF